MRLRPILVIGLTLSLLGVGVPAWSQDDPKSCNDLMADGTPAYVMCRWMATPDQVEDIVRFWSNNDNQNMQAANPPTGYHADCSDPANTCPNDTPDSEAHGDGDPDVPGAEDGGTPECANGDQCFVDPSEVSKQDLAKAEKTTGGQAVKAAASNGMRVWIDTELADDWKAGKLDEAVKELAPLAYQDGVVGVRFATQLGYNQTFTDADELDKFVAEASAALRKTLPGKRLAAHTVMPVFGCGANDACKTAMTEKYPLLNPDRVGAWLAKGQLDQLALDSGTDYSTWKIDTATAQRNQWIQVRAHAWDAYAQIAAEDASFAAAQPSQDAAQPSQDATKAITARIATPLQDAGASSVTLWTRWQDQQGQVHRAYGEKWGANATWDQLKKLTAVHARLATIYDPANPEADQATDLKNLSAVFGQVLIHV
ncbi:hypothetical protein ACIBHX_38795 [Nonomuraea sp. NPDC050536]|uniref:hypothetical protein n=1 Tax=Nonomuraea sp. NPDC050536 TaxID=3364366 RepID=UPI0037C9349C